MKKSSKKSPEKGLRPNVMQRRPNMPQPSPVKPFRINKPRGS